MRFKKILSVLLTLVLILSMSSVAIAKEKNAAVELKLKEEGKNKRISKQLDKAIAEYYRNNKVLDGSNQ